MTYRFFFLKKGFFALELGVFFPGVSGHRIFSLPLFQTTLSYEIVSTRFRPLKAIQGLPKNPRLKRPVEIHESTSKHFPQVPNLSSLSLRSFNSPALFGVRPSQNFLRAFCPHPLLDSPLSPESIAIPPHPRLSSELRF